MIGFAASPDEGAAFLAANPDIGYVETLFTSLNGVPRGKRLRRCEVGKLYGGGAFSPASLAGVDIEGADVPGNGLLWETGDADAVMRPVPGRLVLAPWLGQDVAQVLCSMHALNGTPSPLDPRTVLAGVLERLAKDGFTPVVACELEFYLVDRRRERDGRARLRRSPLTGRAPDGTQALGLTEVEDASDVLRALWAAADAQGLPLEGASAEASPGQLELTLHHRADALAAADDAVMYKRAVKGCARSCGCEATFMAKPFADIAGSGLHVHMSLIDPQGRNVFAAEAPEGSPELRHAIAGMAATMGDAFALLAPNANSYRRHVLHSHAPTAPTWGVNNRTVALRIPAGDPAARRVEHRMAGADANPYLALAALLSGAHHGLTKRLDSGPPTLGDGYALSSNARLPTHWPDALDRLDRSVLMRDYLGDAFVDLFLAVKRDELARFSAVVPAIDHAWYLSNA